MLSNSIQSIYSIFSIHYQIHNQCECSVDDNNRGEEIVHWESLRGDNLQTRVKNLFLLPPTEGFHTPLPIKTSLQAIWSRRIYQTIDGMPKTMITIQMPTF